jgi:glycosyltransferase involved in cell wall biosynthesis
MMVARMIVDKGMHEFIKAAIIINDDTINARFIILCSPYPGNLASLTKKFLYTRNGWHDGEWWGWRDDIAEIMHHAHIVCLPSYREGIPRSFLEAMASGLPIVTTDTTSCRETVVHRDDGLLVPIKNENSLAVALKTLIDNKALRIQMGKRGGFYVVNKFSSKKIIQETLDVYNQFTESP